MERRPFTMDEINGIPKELPNHQGMLPHMLTRRRFCQWGMLALGSTMLNRPAFAAVNSLLIPERSLNLFNVHTEESLKTVYWRDGKYIESSLADINHLLRDHHTDETTPIDPDLLDLLNALTRRLKTDEPIHVVSGYRTRATNAYLRRCYRNVARNSLHISGMAADIYLPGCRLSTLHKTAVHLRGGGVGYYPKDHFIHVDIGRIRYW
ncbi:MAG: DUF882 domain-containing protein [bacterium]